MVRSYSRRNGWIPPPHPLQVMAWLMVLYLSVSTFGVLTQSIGSFSIRIVTYAIMSLVILVNVVANGIVTTIDPSDDAVRKKIRANPRPTFDRNKHQHVIDENYFCNICEAFIQPSSKHCRQCNKCVLRFDHHCRWLNNCIGEKNYRCFLFYVVSTIFTTACILSLSIGLFVLYFVDRDILYQENGTLTVFGIATNEPLWLTLVGLDIAMSSIAALLLSHLLVFHLRIIHKGLTTYEYIVEQRKKEEEMKKHQKNGTVDGKQTRLFRKTKPHPANATGNRHSGQPGLGGNSSNRLHRLKQLLRLRTRRGDTAGDAQQNGVALGSVGASPKHGQAKEELVVSTVSEESYKRGNSEGNEGRSMTPLPPITQLDTQSNARRKKRASRGQWDVPYEIMEDKENRISVSQIAAALPSDAARARGRSGHTAVPRLPPLTGQIGKGTGLTRPIVEAVSKHGLSSSLTSSASAGSKDDENLKEIPLASFSKSMLQLQSVPISSEPVTSVLAVYAQRTSSGSSTGSSGSTLAPLQVHSLPSVQNRTENSPKVGTNFYVANGRHFSHLPYNRRMRLLTEKDTSQFSDSGSVSSGSKRVRFNEKIDAMRLGQNQKVFSR